jgi:hypothetical protein
MFFDVHRIDDNWCFSYLVKGWLIWDFDKPFPFGKKEMITILKISALGIPTGMVFWIFGIR